MNFFKSKTFRIIVALVIVFTSFAAFTGSYNRKTNAACEHSWCNIVYIQSRSCTRDGIRYCRCTKCGVYQYVYDAAYGHSWQLRTYISQPTCTREGLGYYVCATCGASKHDSIPMVRHNYQPRTVCGYTEYYCTECGKPRGY